MDNEITLRDYQQECVDLIDHLDHGSFLISMATGLGKTAIFTHIKRKGRVLILSHRDELVRQPEKYYDCSYGIEKAGEHSNGEEVVSASVPSMVRRLDRFKPDDFDTIITDEAHHAVAPSYQTIYEYFRPRLHLGFTATPNRGDRKKLGEIFSSIIFEKDIQWGIKQHYLCNVKCLRVNVGYDLSHVRSHMGDMNLGQLSAAMEKPQVNGAVIEAYNKYAVGATIIFTTSVKQAYQISENIPDSAVIEANTENRGEILKAYEEGQIKCLINCMVLTEGTDLPCTKTIIMARPTENQSLYIQCVGRGLRLYEDKPYLTLIDCMGQEGRHSLCCAPVLFNLDPKSIPKRKAASMTGMLTEIPQQMQMAADTPESWITNAAYIDVFAQEEGLDMGQISWYMWPDGSLTCKASTDDTIYVSPENNIGQRSCILKKKHGGDALIIKDVPTQSSIFRAREYLLGNYLKSRPLWDAELVDRWSGTPASVKQISFIQRLVRNERWLSQEDIPKNLTKREAGIIIDKLLRKQKGRI